MRATVGSATLHFTLASLAGLRGVTQVGKKARAVAHVYGRGRPVRPSTEATGPGSAWNRVS